MAAAAADPRPARRGVRRAARLFRRAGRGALRADGGGHDPRRHGDVPLDGHRRAALRRVGVRLAADRRRGVLRRRARRCPELLAGRRGAAAGAAQPGLDGALPHGSPDRRPLDGAVRAGAARRLAAADRDLRRRPLSLGRLGRGDDGLRAQWRGRGLRGLGAAARDRRRAHRRGLERRALRSAPRPSPRRCSACCWPPRSSPS